MFKRLFLLLAFLLFAAVPALGADEVLLMVSAPYEGDMQDYGLPTLQAVELAVEDYNAKGGVLGRPVRFIAFNDECQPGRAEDLLKLIENTGATLMVGPICNGMARELLPALTQQGVVTVSPSATDPGLTNARTYPLFFRTMWPADAQPVTQLAFLKTKGLSRVALVHDASEQGIQLGAAIRTGVAADPDLTMVLDQDLRGGEEAVPAIKTILTGEVDAVVYQGERGPGSMFLALLREAGFDGVVIGGDRFWDGSLLAKLGFASEGFYFTGPRDVTENPLHQVALERFRARSEDADPPGPYFYYAYSATLALLHAVEQAQSTEPQEVAAMLRLHRVDTPLGSIRFDDAGDVVGAGMVVYQYKDGEIREVYR